MKPFRSERLGGQIKRELAEILRGLIGDLNGAILTVTEVRLSRDNSNAEVWVSIFGGDSERKETLNRLQSISGRIRHLLANRIYIRRVPELRFQLDETLDYAEKIDGLLKQSGMLTDVESETDEDDEQQPGDD